VNFWPLIAVPIILLLTIAVSLTLKNFLTTSFTFVLHVFALISDECLKDIQFVIFY
jgi:hypothetical protein